MQNFSKPHPGDFGAEILPADAVPDPGIRPAGTSRTSRIEALLARLSQSAFRRKQKLQGADLVYARAHSAEELRTHAVRFIRERLAPAEIPNDGRQTPWRGHPVFVAQHACACCCRKCLFKWQRIPAGRALSEAEIESIADLLMAWIERELGRAAECVEPAAQKKPARQRTRKPAQKPDDEPSLFD